MPSSDRPTVPNEACEHKIATHVHGTLICYLNDGCRCAACRGARSRYDREYHQKVRKPRIEERLEAEWYPGSPVWLDEMRRGLKRAVEDSIERHGRVA